MNDTDKPTIPFPLPPRAEGIRGERVELVPRQIRPGHGRQMPLDPLAVMQRMSGVLKQAREQGAQAGRLLYILAERAGGPIEITDEEFAGVADNTLLKIRRDAERGVIRIWCEAAPAEDVPPADAPGGGNKEGGES